MKVICRIFGGCIQSLIVKAEIKEFTNLLIGLTDMIKELESEQFVRGTDHGSSNSSSWVTLDLQGTRKVKIPR